MFPTIIHNGHRGHYFYYLLLMPGTKHVRANMHSTTPTRQIPGFFFIAIPRRRRSLPNLRPKPNSSRIRTLFHETLESLPFFYLITMYHHHHHHSLRNIERRSPFRGTPRHAETCEKHSATYTQHTHIHQQGRYAAKIPMISLGVGRGFVFCFCYCFCFHLSSVSVLRRVAKALRTHTLATPPIFFFLLKGGVFGLCITTTTTTTFSSPFLYHNFFSRRERERGRAYHARHQRDVRHGPESRDFCFGLFISSAE